jgi:hypothetical protein
MVHSEVEYTVYREAMRRCLHLPGRQDTAGGVGDSEMLVESVQRRVLSVVQRGQRRSSRQ